MERPQALKNYNPYRFLVIFYLIGLAGHIIPYTRPNMLLITSPALMISVITILIPFIRDREWKVLIYIVCCGIAGFIAEMIGVNTGMLFGNYSYGDVLGPGIYAVPFILILNWIIILAGSLSLSEMLFSKNIFIVPSAALLSVVFDYIMEPAAVFFRYWAWAGDNVPLMNYATWGALIFFFSLIFVLLKFKIRTRLPAFLFVIQCIYFLIFRILVYFRIMN